MDGGREGVGGRETQKRVKLRSSRCSKSPSVLSSPQFASWGPSQNIILLFLHRKEKEKKTFIRSYTVALLNS